MGRQTSDDERARGVAKANMVVALPLGKLVYLGIKQISRPISRRIQAGAVRSPLFRKYVCVPPAQCKENVLTSTI